MIDSASPTALITGGSSGIGYELARCFAQDGYRIILVASGRPALEEARNRIAMEFHGDVTAIAKDHLDPYRRCGAVRRAGDAGHSG